MRSLWPLLVALVLLTSCSNHHADAASAQDATTTTTTADVAATAATEPPANDSSEDKTGTGHLSLTGGFTLERDFTVETCAVAPPGDGLLSGYHMQSKDGAPQITMLSVVLKNYDKDGAYVIASSSREEGVAKAMTGVVMGPLTVMITPEGSPIPRGFLQAADSKLTIAISADGGKGHAQFTDLESPVTMDDVDPHSSATPHGKRVSGSLTWTCGSVSRLNAKMNDAVNGMFKKLIPR